jgi:hypothetical protein
MSVRCKGKIKSPGGVTLIYKDWDRCYRRTTHESGYCYQHRSQVTP